MWRAGLQRARGSAWAAAAAGTASCSGLEAARALPVALHAARSIRADACAAPWPARHFSGGGGGGGDEEQREITDPTVLELAEQITQLNLLQVSDLTEVLKRKLGITAGPMMGMPMGMPMAGGAAPAAPAAPIAAAAPVEEKTEFTLKLDGFDAASKIKVIKEVRAITGLGLKEAKELVEGAPKVVKEGLKKEEAEALQKTLVEAGAKVSLD